MKRITAILTGIAMLLAGIGQTPVFASHTFEEPMDETERAEILEHSADQYTLVDGVYYSATGYPLSILEEYIPNAGDCDRYPLLTALAAEHPDAKFAVDVQSWVSYYFEEERKAFQDTATIDGMTYTEFWQKAYEIEQNGTRQEKDAMLEQCQIVLAEEQAYIAKLEAQVREEEQALFLENGLTSLEGGNPAWRNDTLILTAEQVNDFPGHEKCGYMLGLAAQPQETLPPTDPVDILNIRLGDVTEEGVIDIMDVLLMNRYLLGKCTISDTQKLAADTDRNGAFDFNDSLLILKYVVEVIDAFD